MSNFVTFFVNKFAVFTVIVEISRYFTLSSQRTKTLAPYHYGYAMAQSLRSGVVCNGSHSNSDVKE